MDENYQRFQDEVLRKEVQSFCLRFAPTDHRERAEFESQFFYIFQTCYRESQKPLMEHLVKIISGMQLSTFIPLKREP